MKELLWLKSGMKNKTVKLYYYYGCIWWVNRSKHKIATGERIAQKVVQRKLKFFFEDVWRLSLNWAKAK